MVSYSSVQGLMAALQSFQKLEGLRLYIESVPREALALLLSAGKEGRCFTLELVAEHAACMAQLFDLSDMWELAQPLFPSVALIPSAE